MSPVTGYTITSNYKTKQTNKQKTDKKKMRKNESGDWVHACTEKTMFSFHFTKNGI